MTTIYVVTAGSYSDYHICGVFSTRARAEEYSANHGGEGIEEYGLDDWLAEREMGLKYYRVNMKLDGNDATVKSDEPGSYDYKDGFIGRPMSGTAWFSMSMWTKDEEHALKIANDRRREKIANGDRN